MPILKSLKFERKKQKLHKLSNEKQTINPYNKENENNYLLN